MELLSTGMRTQSGEGMAILFNIDVQGCLGGSVVECLPSAQGVILESQDRVLHRAPHGSFSHASPSAYVSASLCVSLTNE